MRRKPKISMADYEALMEPYFNAAAICVANGGVVADDPGSTDDGGTNDDGGGFEAPTVAF
jgi:hypothetical protein